MRMHTCVQLKWYRAKRRYLAYRNFAKLSQLSLSIGVSYCLTVSAKLVNTYAPPRSISSPISLQRVLCFVCGAPYRTHRA